MEETYHYNSRTLIMLQLLHTNARSSCTLVIISLDSCIYTLKEYIDYYKQRSTTVFGTFLDASKAFDKINYWLLFQKLFVEGFPTFIIKILAFW